MENTIVGEDPITNQINSNNSTIKDKSINMDSLESQQNIQIMRMKQTNTKIKYEYLFKIALIGDSSTGKTSILLRFTDNLFKDDTSSTIGVDFKILSISLGNEKFAKMQIWDTCGSERFKALTMSFIKSCPAFLLIFDITKYKTFKNLENWIRIINENACAKLMCLVGNKCDLENQRQVSKEEALLFAEKNGLRYIETSAKTNKMIEDVFLFVCESLLDEISKRKSTSPDEKMGNNNTFEIGGYRNLVSNTEMSNNSLNDRTGCCKIN